MIVEVANCERVYFKDQYYILINNREYLMGFWYDNLQGT